MRRVVVGSRGSALAREQTQRVTDLLRSCHPDVTFDVCIITTKGDRHAETPLHRIGGKGLFTKELEEALYAGEIDLAVHSLKDLPSELPSGLALAAVVEREDPRDVLVSRLGLPLAQLPQDARIGTGSLRRSVQLRAFRPDLQIVGLRGNIDTRLRKAEGPDYDGIVVAAAGLHRLGLANRITEYLPLEVCLPAVGQGALAIETRQDDAFVRKLVQRINHPATESAARAERAFLHTLAGGCQVPLAAYARIEGGVLSLSKGEEMVVDGMLASPEGDRLVRAQERGDSFAPEALGQSLAQRLLALGGQQIVATRPREKD